MLEGPILNPMHPPLAKEIIALSIKAFGDVPLGWRYPAALFGALALVAVYLGGARAVRIAGARDRGRAVPSSTRCCFVQSRIAMLDIFALTFGLFAIAAFIRGFRQTRPQSAFALAGLARGAGECLQMERAVRARDLHRDRRSDPPAARLACALRRCRCGGLVPPGAVAGFPACRTSSSVSF